MKFAPETAMVRGFAMDSQDKRMCKTESAFSSVTVDCNHWVCDEDSFGDILDIFDFPMESLEGDGLAEDWASKLGPIPSEVFRELLPPVSQIGHSGNGYGSAATDLPSDHPLLNSIASQLKPQPNLSKLYTLPGAFNAPSPKSVLERRNSSSNSKPISSGVKPTVPVRTRTKRTRPATNPWMLSHLILPPNKNNKRKFETNRSNALGIKKCLHCEITKTPQWREGPMGPKTLCNACGVRFRSGRLYPEYRPAASPTFVPSLHSNSHRKVIEMRQKGVKHTEWF